MSNIPSSNIEQLIQESISARLVHMHTCLPATISSFDSEKQVCTVDVVVKRVIRQQDGTDKKQVMPPIADAPLLFPQMSGFTITYPMQPGDECIVIFSERDIDNWHSAGIIDAPRSSRKFSLSDGFVLPFTSNQNKKISSYDKNNLEIRTRDGSSKIILKQNGDIELMNSGRVDIKSPTTKFTGNVEIDGNLTVTGNVDADGTVESGAISLSTHVHGGVTSGGDSTSGPV